jgi:beta-lactamase class A
MAKKQSEAQRPEEKEESTEVLEPVKGKTSSEKRQTKVVGEARGVDVPDQKPAKKAARHKQAEPARVDSAAELVTEDTAKPAAVKRGRNALPLVGMAVFCVAALLIALFAGNAGRGASSSSSPMPSSQTVASSSAPIVSSLVVSSQEEPAIPNWSELITFSEKDIQRLDSMLAGWAAYAEEEEPLGHQVAVYFKDIDSGLEYIYNGGQTFYMASLNKAPYALYLYHLVDIGQITLGDTFYVTYGGVNGGAEESGRIQSDPTLPRDYTLEELIYYLLRYSDTGAMRVLLQHFSAAGFAEFAGHTIGIPNTTRLQALLSGRIDAVDAGLYLNALFNYMENGAHGAELKEHMLNASYKMIRSEHPVAHKYGWDKNAYHDMAVVYAEHPYMLAILTGKSNGSGAAYGMFGTIAGVFEEMMQEKWTVAKQEY